MNVIYSRYNRERLPKFQTETLIYKDIDKLYVRKRSCHNDAVNHVNSIYRNFLLLQNNCGDLKISPATGGNNYVDLDFIKGDSYEKILIKLVINGKQKEFLEAIAEYTKLLYSLETVNINNLSDIGQFSKIFGIFDINANYHCLKISNIDLNFDNIILNYENNYCIIDYEWVFEFPVPIKYIIFRSIYSFYIKFDYYLKDFITIEVLLGLCGIENESTKMYYEMEQNFQSYVYGKTLNYSLDNYVKEKIRLPEIANRVQELSKQLEDRDKQIINLLDSKSWRLTKPVRKAVNFLKRKN